MDKKFYLFNEIINDNNLLFNLKLDWTFKNIFLNKSGFNYLCLIISKVLNIDIKSLKKDMYLVNSELPSKIINIKSSRTDIICKYKLLYIIIEMNNSDKELHINKNYGYLFKQHSSRLTNKNSYGKKIKTILLNIDNYDVLNSKSFIYDSILYFPEYNKNIYKNIEIIHINLDYLKKKYYNNNKLSNLEKIFIIFIEQRKNKILQIVNRKEINEIMDYMSRLNFQEGDPVTYDGEEFEKIKKERTTAYINKAKRLHILINSERKDLNNLKLEVNNLKIAVNREKEMLDKNIEKFFKEKELLENEKETLEDEKETLENEKETLENEKETLENEKETLENEKETLENEKKYIAKELKLLGLPLNKIIELTKLSDKEINMI